MTSSAPDEPARAPGGDAPLLDLRGLSKRYGASWALRGVDLVAGAGEVHALLGANGAGKSTLLHLLGGIAAPTAGEIRLDGRPVIFATPADAARAGVSSVHQELAVLPQLTVAENVWLAREPRTGFGALDRRAMRRQTVDLLGCYGLPLDPDAVTASLSVASRQLVEIARALSASTRILSLDEPSAVLSLAERKRLFEIVRRLKAAGLLVLFVSHRLEEVFEITDRVTVLRNGAKAFEGETARTTRDELVRAMVGRAVGELRAHVRSGGAPRLPYRVSVNAARSSPVDIEIAPGEIVGFAGLVGGGRTRLARRLAGLEPDAVATWRTPDGETFTLHSAREAIARGLVYLTEDRKRDGLFLNLPVATNASAASLARIAIAGWLSRRRERAAVLPMLDRLRLVAASLATPVRALSGGNQQKVLFARALLATPRVLLCDEPTRGVDVAAREEIYDLIQALAERGVAVLVISSELKELIELCHRLLVVRGATVVAELPAGSEESAIVEAAA